MKNQAEQKVKDIIIENGGFLFIFQTKCSSGGRSQQAVFDTSIQRSVKPLLDKNLYNSEKIKARKDQEIVDYIV